MKKPVISVTIICCLLENIWGLENISVCKLSSVYEFLCQWSYLVHILPWTAPEIFLPRLLNSCLKWNPNQRYLYKDLGLAFCMSQLIFKCHNSGCFMAVLSFIWPYVCLTNECMRVWNQGHSHKCQSHRYLCVLSLS